MYNNQIDYDELVQQSRVDSLFKPLKERFARHLEEIDELEFLFKNCCYNESRILGEINLLRAGFVPPSEETKVNVVKTFRLKNLGSKVEMGIPTTLWDDILLFEFHAFLSNIVRCCNFLTIFKMRRIDNTNSIKFISIGKYCNPKSGLQKKIKDKGKEHDLILSKYLEWVKDVNLIRDITTHEHIVLKIPSDLIFSYERISETTIEAKGNQKIIMPHYKIDNIEEYLSETLGKLESFIKEFFVIYGERQFLI